MRKTSQLAMLLVTIILTGCYSGSEKNKESVVVEGSIDSVTLVDPIDRDTIQTAEPKQSISTLLYIDVSKGMSGYYAGLAATRFKTDVWSVLTALNSSWGTDSIMLLSEKKPRLVDITTFRQNMNEGKLLYDNNTSIPQMIKDIMVQIEQTEGCVGVLVSDMKYSPTNSKAPQAEMAQYATDIEQIFEAESCAVSLICAVSDYKTKSRSCEKAPYYYLIIGKPWQVATVRNVIVNRLKAYDSFFGEVEKSVDYGERLALSHIKARGVIPLDKESLVYGGYDKKVADTVTVTVKFDLSAYPYFLWNRDTLATYLSAASSGFAQCFISDVETNDNEAMFAMNVYGIKSETQNITISLSGYNPSLPREIEQFYGAEKEADCDRTISIDQFVQGIADKRQFQSTATITITKKNKI